jgi:hypothetical protein
MNKKNTKRHFFDMADFSAFSNPNFEPTLWINQLLKNHNQDEPLESFLAQIAMKLHIVSQDYTDQLETGAVTRSVIDLMILITVY